MCEAICDFVFHIFFFFVFEDRVLVLVVSDPLLLTGCTTPYALYFNKLVLANLDNLELAGPALYLLKIQAI